MKIKDHFLTQETFEIVETEIKGVYKTSPIPENLGKYYESKEYISHHQDDNSFKEKAYKFFQSFNLSYKKNILKEYINDTAKVLDYGCGAGEFIKYIENDFTTIGYEPSEAARNFAKQKITKASVIEDLNSIENESLDAITLWHVFEHIANQDEMLNLFRTKLKPEGILIIAVPNCSSYDAKHYKEYWAAYDVPRHVFHFSKNGMQNLMKEKNWNLIKIKSLLLDSYYISMLSEKYKKNSFSWLKFPFYGTISNIKAIFNDEFSSLIYIIKKK